MDLDQTTPHKRRSSSSRKRRRRRPEPPKKQWMLPALGAAIGLVGLIFVGLLIKTFFFPADPEKAVGDESAEMAQEIQDFYKGDYTLISNDTLVKKKLLPNGITPAARSDQLRSNWGEVLVLGANPQGQTQPPYTHFLISYANIPSQVCTTFVPTLMQRYGQIWIGRQTRSPDPRELLANASEIQARCAASPTVSIMVLGK
jgi:hypothetical protein